MSNTVAVVISTAGASFTAQFDAGNYEAVTFACSGLGAAESVTIKEEIGSSFKTTRDSDGNAVTFTGSGGTPANRDLLTLVGGLVYQFSSTTPVGVIVIDAAPLRGIGT